MFDIRVILTNWAIKRGHHLELTSQYQKKQQLRSELEILKNDRWISPTGELTGDIHWKYTVMAIYQL